MKNLALIASLLLSVSALAKVGPESPWEDIIAARNIQIDAGKVQFGNRFFSVLETCYAASADMMRTAKKVTIYDRRDNGDRTIWVPVGKDFLHTSRVYEREVCRGMGRECQWEVETREYSLSPKVSVRKAPRGDRSFGDLLFTKVFNVPSCQ